MKQTNQPDSNRAKRVVIIGGGFAGVTLAQRLECSAPKETEIVLLSSENHFVFTPLLAETAGREISPLHAVIPGRQMVKRARWMTADVTDVDRLTNRVYFRSHAGHSGSIDYDHLVLACGSVVDFSTVPGLAEHAYPFKTLGDAVFLSNDLIGRLEEAAVSMDPEERQRLLTVVVIGGGFSGVEIAGALNDLMKRAQILSAASLRRAANRAFAIGIARVAGVRRFQPVQLRAEAAACGRYRRAAPHASQLDYAR